MASGEFLNGLYKKLTNRGLYMIGAKNKQHAT